MKRKQDRRVARTRQFLRDSLMILIHEQGYESITVQDITDRANIGRATFYMHYRDKEELLLKSLLNEYETLVERVKDVESMMGRPAGIRVIFDSAAQNSAMYRVILSGAGKTSAYQLTRDFLAERVTERLNKLPKQPDIPLEIMAVYIAGAILNLLSWWIDNDMPYSIDEMMGYINRLIFQSSDSTGSRESLRDEI